MRWEEDCGRKSARSDRTCADVTGEGSERAREGREREFGAGRGEFTVRARPRLWPSGFPSCASSMAACGQGTPPRSSGGPPMNPRWTPSGPPPDHSMDRLMDSLRSTLRNPFGPSLDPLWTLSRPPYGHPMDPLRTPSRPPSRPPSGPAPDPFQDPLRPLTKLISLTCSRRGAHGGAAGHEHPYGPSLDPLQTPSKPPLDPFQDPLGSPAAGGEVQRRCRP
eukprot:1195952-Prorocentrum_minimum.AAC.1